MFIRESLALRFSETKVEILDQTLLPHQERWVDVTDPLEMEKAIISLKVRGAPLIGVAASLCLGVFCLSEQNKEQRNLWANALLSSRPTAVNLIHHMNELIQMIQKNESGTAIFNQAIRFFDFDQKNCDLISDFGFEEMKAFSNILTHCNTGGLATAGVGTALGVIKKLAQNNKETFVYVDETRPLLQGGRLTTWELIQAKVKFKLICDNMAGFLMKQGKVDAVVVGADRITSNGDSANKIGSYSLAVLCHFHKIPFYIAAPMTTVDSSLISGEEIPIEQRNPKEVMGFVSPLNEVIWAPLTAQVYNPAFDWVPSHLITAWITDRAVYKLKDVELGCFK